MSSFTRGEAGDGLESLTEAMCTAGIDTATCVEVEWSAGAGWHGCPSNGNFVIASIYRSTNTLAAGGFADLNKISCCKLITGLSFSSCEAVSSSYLQAEGSVAKCSEGSIMQSIKVSNTGVNAATSQPLSSLSGLRCCALAGGLSDLVPLIADQGSSCTAKTDMFGRTALVTSTDSSCPIGTRNCYSNTNIGAGSSQTQAVDTAGAQWDLLFRQTQTDVCGIPTMNTVQVESSGSFETSSSLIYNGVDHSLHSNNAFNVVVLDMKTENHYTNTWGGFVSSTRAYATGTGGSIAEVHRMMADIAALRSGVVVLLACEGECATFTSQVSGFEGALQKLGASGFNTQELFQSFAMIGQQGAGHGRAVQHSVKKGTVRVGFGKRQKGFCVKRNGGDENAGVVKLASGDFQTEEQVKQCWAKCAAYPGVTGCETIWNQGNRGCYVHTSNAIVRGNGVKNHYCALYDSTARVDDSKVSFSCTSFSHVDALDDTTESLFEADEWNRNSHNPAAANYAILDQLENFRNQDGSFLFKLVYPRAEQEYTRVDNTGATFASVEMIWSQNNNPATDRPGTPTSQYISYKVHADQAGCNWNGLHRSSTTSKSLMTGSSGNPYYAIGAMATNARGLFGGACKSAYSASQVNFFFSPIF